MKKRTLFPFIILTLSAFIFHKSMIIKPGESVGPFYINKTTLKDLKSKLGKGKFVTEKFYSPNCNMIYTYKKLEYKNEGITFVFNSDKLNANDKINSIELSDKCDAVTVEHISAGYSIRNEVYKAFGQPNLIDTLDIIKYPNLGISFKFSNTNRSCLTDTVNKIFIYSPTGNE